MRIRRILTATVATAALFGLAACGGGSPTTSADPGGDSTNGGGKYVVVLKTLGSEFWQKMEQGVKDKAKELGVDVDVLAGNSEDDLEGQVSLVENALSQGYDGIGVAPISADNLVNVVAAATAQGIPVVNIDEKINMDSLAAADGAVIGFVTTDNVKVGETGANYIIELLGAEGGEVAIIEGKAGTASGEARKEGATKAFEGNSAITLVDSQPADWDRTKAYDLATNYMAKYPNLKATTAPTTPWRWVPSRPLRMLARTSWWLEPTVMLTRLSRWRRASSPPRLLRTALASVPRAWRCWLTSSTPAPSSTPRSRPKRSPSTPS